MIRIAGEDQGREFQLKTGIDGSTLSRWKRGESGGLRADKVAAFARGYGAPVLEAFVEAGFISPDEAGAAPAAKPDLAAITDDQLVELVRQRLHERGGGEHAERRGSAPIAERQQARPASTASELEEQLRTMLAEAKSDEQRAHIEGLLADVTKAREVVSDPGRSASA